MKEATSFTFNGVNSIDMGVILADDSSGLFEEQFMTPYKANFNTNQFTGKTVHTRDQREPIKFKLLIYLEKWQERNNLREITRWLYPLEDGHFPLEFDNYPNRMVYARVSEFDSLKHNGVQQGYFEVEFTTNDSYVSSDPLFTEPLQVTGSTVFEIKNDGDIPMLPRVWFIKKGKGSLEIRNDKTGKTLKIDELLPNEKLYIDNAQRLILSSQEEVTVYRANNHNRIWLEIQPDYLTNTPTKLTIIGEGEIQFELQEKYNTWF